MMEKENGRGKREKRRRGASMYNMMAQIRSSP